MNNDFGQTVITRGLAADIKNDEKLKNEIYIAWKKYCAHDWGILGDEDKKMNDEAIRVPGSDRILARYKTHKGDIYIITESDRSYTTFLYCNEY